jgi:signal transduction histidine kinase
MRDAYLALDAIIAVGLFALSVTSLLRKGYKYPVNRLFAYLSILVGLWIATNHISNDIYVPNSIALFADYIVFSSSLGVAMLMACMVVKLANARRFEKIVDKVMWPLRFLCLLCFTPLLVNSIEASNDVYNIKFGPLLPLYAAGLAFTIFAIAYGLFHGLKYSKGIKRRQLVVIGIGLAISVPLVLLLSFVIPVITGNFFITEFGITPLIILVISLYYSVVRYGLFDIRRAVMRTVAYALSLFVISAIYYSVAYIVSMLISRGNTSSTVSVSPYNIILALILAFIFQPVRNFFEKISNGIFYKYSYNTDDFFAKLNKTLTITTDLRNLLERTSEEIGNTLKSERVFFFINTFDGHYISAGTQGHKQLPKNDAIQLGECEDANDDVIVSSLLEDNDSVHRLMLRNRIELVLRLRQSNRILGYLCLGYRKTSEYTYRDIRVLSTIADGLAIAIQNALSIQEVKDINEHLQQRINAATKELRTTNEQLQRLDKAKDEFVSMASHQLRTPLTSIKGYLSMILDGDVGHINDQMRQMLNNAFMSSERMVHLINDFLNMSRIQTGRFIIEKTMVDLSKVISQEIGSLQPTAIAHGTKFIYDQPTDFPLVYVDESKIRQVIMNFADNAIFYSKSGTEIDIILEHDKDMISFMVKDHGIGVPESEKAQLFTKFFRASNARTQRPDGTGVGLYLAKRIVDTHKGKIIFESTEGKGSTFGFCIPIKQD